LLRIVPRDSIGPASACLFGNERIIEVEDRIRLAQLDHPPFVKERHRVAERFDRTRVMGCDESGNPLCFKRPHSSEALLLKVRIAHGQDLLNYEYLWVDASRQRKPQPKLHATRVGTHRQVDELPQFSKGNDRLQPFRQLLLRQP
jgi:hypothetical protein